MFPCLSCPAGPTTPGVRLRIRPRQQGGMTRGLRAGPSNLLHHLLPQLGRLSRGFHQSPLMRVQSATSFRNGSWSSRAQNSFWLGLHPAGVATSWTISKPPRKTYRQQQNWRSTLRLAYPWRRLPEWVRQPNVPLALRVLPRSRQASACARLPPSERPWRRGVVRRPAPPGLLPPHPCAPSARLSPAAGHLAAGLALHRLPGATQVGRHLHRRALVEPRVQDRPQGPRRALADPRSRHRCQGVRRLPAAARAGLRRGLLRGPRLSWEHRVRKSQPNQATLSKAFLVEWCLPGS
mmetsp:Transcript_94365/g.236897  ORF Transcript_94365/g.236897 Transcript_94365/m.236897 type:complete len:293 (+) Transcript_94365:266-1144(+)